MAWRLIEKFRRPLASVLRDRRGATAMMFAFMIVPIFASVGLAVDSSLGYLLKSRMSKSLDAAGLAAGRVALNEDAEDIAWSYFTSNFSASGGSASVVREDFAFDLSPDGRFVTLSVVGDTPTLFMRIFGRDTMTVSARTRIERETTGMELALVLDNTGSMSQGGKFTAMRAAARDLIDILYGDESEIDNLWVSVVPFVATVNIGSSRTSWILPGDRVHTNPTSWANSGANRYWKGCVMARSYPRDVDDTPPSGSDRFTSYRWPSGQSSNRNYTCGAPIQSLTAIRSEINSAINAMAAAPMAGGTTANEGLAWGWRTLSPRWRGLWGGSTPANLPLDYDEPQMTKVAVVLTDGQNQLVYNDYTAYGYPSALGYSRTSDSVDMLDDRMTEVCEAMKAEGIQIFTIMFGLTPGTTTHNQVAPLFRGCATNPAMYYDAVTNADLATAFRAIGGQLANLRIVE